MCKKPEAEHVDAASARPETKTATNEETRYIHLEQQAYIRSLRGQLHWKGSLNTLRTDLTSTDENDTATCCSD
jgi:hypothetical protein